MAAHPPTSEQQAAIDLFSTGRNLVIKAGAGTGKTSTLLFIAQSTGRRGQGIAFNKSIVKENQRRFPGSCNWSTAHSLAVRSVGGQFEDRKRQGKRARTIEVAARLGIDAIRVPTPGAEDESKLLSPTFLAGLVMRAVKEFCKTPDAAPSRVHVPKAKGLEDDANALVARHLETPLLRAWADLSNPEGGLPFTTDIFFSVCLKVWQLSNPLIAADYILFDEAQDANPVMAAVVALQGDREFRAARGMRPAQLVYVGDDDQAINGFTGAVNAMATMQGNRTLLTQSFRFGPAVAHVANHLLALIPGSEMRVKGFDPIASVVGTVAEPDAILTRTNAAAVHAVLDAQRAGRVVHLVGGGTDVVAFALAARDLQSGIRTDHEDLACFDDWNEVLDYVTNDEQGKEIELLVKLVEEFGVPTILDALEHPVSEEDAELVVSTAHKSKGREWGSVKIGSDFPEGRIAVGGEDAVDELRLLYVAVTRAKLELDVTDLPFLRDLAAPRARSSAPVVPAPVRERKPIRRSQHVGTVGQSLTLNGVRCDSAKGMATRFGWTHLTRFTDPQTGNVYKTFLDEELVPGTVYDVSGRVKAHDEFKGVDETQLNYVVTYEASAAEVSA